MNLLLDTHLLLGAAGQPDRLSTAALNYIESPDNQLFFSAASLWEINIKRSLGRPDFHVDPRVLRRGLIDNGYEELSVRSDHALHLDALPNLHKDPFDRILLAQALFEGLTLLTADHQLAQYAGPVKVV
jgi:PIN domain nuclease of toxin-antitoxin system